MMPGRGRESLAEREKRSTEPNRGDVLGRRVAAVWTGRRLAAAGDRHRQRSQLGSGAGPRRERVGEVRSQGTSGTSRTAAASRG
jgi:hypothetical protein